MRTFVENVKVLAGESSLLSQMPNILKVDDIYNLSIAKIESIVAESSELDVCRRKPQIDRMMLNEALQACNQHSANHGQGTLASSHSLGPYAYLMKPHHGHCLSCLHPANPHDLT